MLQTNTHRSNKRGFETLQAQKAIREIEANFIAMWIELQNYFEGPSGGVPHLQTVEAQPQLPLRVNMSRISSVTAR